jgi:hypothetical protein
MDTTEGTPATVTVTVATAVTAAATLAASSGQDPVLAHMRREAEAAAAAKIQLAVRARKDGLTKKEDKEKAPSKKGVAGGKTPIAVRNAALKK